MKLKTTSLEMFLSRYNGTQDLVSQRRSIEGNNSNNNLELMVIEKKSMVKVDAIEIDQFSPLML